MGKRIWTAYQVEMGRLMRQKTFYIGPMLVLALILFAPVLHSLHRDGVSDYGFIAYVTPMILDALGFLLFLLFSASLISSDVHSGGIRQFFLRQLYRYEYVLAKLLVGMTYATLLVLLVGIGAWGLALGFGELRGVSYGGELLYSPEQMLSSYGMGMLLSLAPLWAGVAYGILFSVFFRTQLASVTGALGGWILLDFIKYPLQISSYIFTTYMTQPWQVFVDRCDGIDGEWFPMVWRCLSVSAITWGLCTVLAAWVLRRKDLG